MHLRTDTHVHGSSARNLPSPIAQVQGPLIRSVIDNGRCAAAPVYKSKNYSTVWCVPYVYINILLPVPRVIAVVVRARARAIVVIK